MKSENKSRLKFDIKTQICTEDEYSKNDKNRKKITPKYTNNFQILKNKIEVFCFEKNELKILDKEYEEKLINNNIEFSEQKKILLTKIFEILENYFSLSKNNFLWDLQIDSFSFFNNFFNVYRNVLISLKNQKNTIFFNLQNLEKLKNLLKNSNVEKIENKNLEYKEDSLILIKNNLNLFLEKKHIELENEKILNSYAEKVQKEIFDFKIFFEKILKNENYLIIKQYFKIKIFENSVKFRKICLFLENSKNFKKIIKKIFKKRFEEFYNSSNLIIKQDIDKENLLIKNIFETLKKLKFFLLIESKLHQKFVFNKNNKIVFKKFFSRKNSQKNTNYEKFDYNSLQNSFENFKKRNKSEIQKENFEDSEIFNYSQNIIKNNFKENLEKRIFLKEDFENCLNQIFGISDLEIIIKNLPFDSKDFFLIENPNLKKLLFFVEKKIVLLKKTLDYIKNLFCYFLPEIQKNLLKFFHFTFGDIIFFSEQENNKKNKKDNFKEIFLELIENIKFYQNNLKKYFRKNNNLNLKKNDINIEISNLEINIKNSNFLISLNEIHFSNKKKKKIYKKTYKRNKNSNN